jgi:hypothetical protein
MPLTSSKGLSRFPELDSDIVRGIGLFGLPQAMLSLSQKVSSPSPRVVLPEFSSPIVVSVESIGLLYIGDCIDGSGEVPQDELGPWFEFDDAEGELYVVL